MALISGRFQNQKTGSKDEMSGMLGDHKESLWDMFLDVDLHFMDGPGAVKVVEVVKKKKEVCGVFEKSGHYRKD